MSNGATIIKLQSRRYSETHRESWLVANTIQSSTLTQMEFSSSYRLGSSLDFLSGISTGNLTQDLCALSPLYT